MKILRVGLVEQKLSQLADDTTLLDSWSTEHSLSSLQDFKIIFGLLVKSDRL